MPEIASDFTPEIRRTAVLTTKMAIASMPAAPLVSITAVLTLALAGLLSAVPPAELAAARATAEKQLEDAIALMTAPGGSDAVEAG